MTIIRKIRIAIIVVLCFSLSGCNTVPRSWAEVQREYQRSWFSSSKAQGAIVGLVASGGTCVVAGGTTGECAAIALGGAAVGFIAADYMDSLRNSKLTEEEQLEKILSDIQIDIINTTTYQSTARKVIDEQVARLNDIKQSLGQKNLSFSEIQTELVRQRKIHTNLTEDAKELEKRHDEWKATDNEFGKVTDKNLQQKKREIAREIKKMQDQIKTIKEDNKFFLKQLNDIDITTTG